MRDIDFIPAVVTELASHQPRIEERFNEEDGAFKKLLAQDHNLIGRVLKCHLIVENYINRYLESASPAHNWLNARLSFSQKIELLPHANPKVAWVLSGIRELNAIRNRFSHRITAHVTLNDLTECSKVLAIARNETKYSEPVVIIEDFTMVACTWLIIDREIEAVFEEAFKRARKKVMSRKR